MDHKKSKWDEMQATRVEIQHPGRWTVDLRKRATGRFLVVGLALALVGGAIGAGLAQEAALQGETFYYKKGQKVPLKVDTSKNFVMFKSQMTEAAVEKATKPARAVLHRFDAVPAPTGLNLTNEPPNQGAKWAIIDNVDIAAQPLDQAEIAQDVLYKAPFFITGENKQVGISHLVLVKLKAPEDKAELATQAKALKVEIIGNNKQLPLWYTLACTKNSVGNALQVANKLAESGKFAASEPDFLTNFQIDQGPSPTSCADDTHFSKQWGLRNTGQHGGTVGIDINVCEAWSEATGKGIKVAVVDHGIQRNHPDLQANVSTLSFDTVTGTSPSQVRGNHGTACAGIVAAIRNNSQLGVAGVAPEATLISVSDTLLLSPNAAQNLASGLTWAAQNGADVISNSWGHNNLSSTILDDAIDEALTSGRGGKGCVVIFAAGNENGVVGYPARTNPDILAVGAISPCGQRKSPTSCDSESWGSNFGSELDIVAPGVFIPTTDRTGTDGYDSGDYTFRFNGTSSATPHVAGVAALILQINPNLTQREVVTIIERSGRKIGPYNYQATTGRPNGDYHQEMGYGLVDAKACVQAARQRISH